MIPISAERMAQLEEYAHRRGQDTAAALDSALAEYLDWEQRESREVVAGVLEGYEDMKAGRSQSIEEAFEELRVTHGLSR